MNCYVHELARFVTNLFLYIKIDLE